MEAQPDPHVHLERAYCLSSHLLSQGLSPSPPLLGLFRGLWSTRIPSGGNKATPPFRLPRPSCQAQYGAPRHRSPSGRAPSPCPHHTAHGMAPPTLRFARVPSDLRVLTARPLPTEIKGGPGHDATHCALCFWSSLSHLLRRRLPAALLLDDKVHA
ncbi:hypothetical protein LY76DRAFT_17413 [Colletotrichum caudatum]|nr:hypothetical protein LY76DRAFT_17413 [Colletotrichum caudatum]